MVAFYSDRWTWTWDDSYLNESKVTDITFILNILVKMIKIGKTYSQNTQKGRVFFRVLE
jgi:hypothetical protein